MELIQVGHHGPSAHSAGLGSPSTLAAHSDRVVPPVGQARYRRVRAHLVHWAHSARRGSTVDPLPAQRLARSAFPYRRGLALAQRGRSRCRPSMPGQRPGAHRLESGTVLPMHRVHLPARRVLVLQSPDVQTPAAAATGAARRWPLHPPGWHAAVPAPASTQTAHAPSARAIVPVADASWRDRPAGR